MRNRLQMSAVYTNITHELLTPLTVISASVDRLREKAPSNEQDYDLMQLNIERMVRLLQQILETSKSQSGELKLLVAHGDVMQYIQRTALCIEPLMAKKGLDFTIQCEPESMMGWIDNEKMNTVIYCQTGQDYLQPAVERGEIYAGRERKGDAASTDQQEIRPYYY